MSSLLIKVTFSWELLIHLHIYALYPIPSQGKAFTRTVRFAHAVAFAIIACFREDNILPYGVYTKNRPTSKCVGRLPIISQNCYDALASSFSVSSFNALVQAPSFFLNVEEGLAGIILTAQVMLEISLAHAKEKSV